MKLTPVILLAILLIPTAVHAGCSSFSDYAGFTYHHCDDGTTGVSIPQVGGSVDHYFDGYSGSSIRIGGSVQHSFRDGVPIDAIGAATTAGSIRNHDTRPDGDILRPMVPAPVK